MVGLVGEAKVDRGRLRLPGVLTAAILVVIMMALGFLGWVLPSPGGSLIVPTLIVFGVGCSLVIAYWIITGGRATAMVVTARLSPEQR